MTVIAPNDISSNFVSFTIKVDGKEIDNTVIVTSIVTTSKINQIPNAQIEISDGSSAAMNFPVTDSRTFMPGCKIQITAGYTGDQETTIFSGVITKAGQSINGNVDSKLIIDATDPALIMTLSRNNGVHLKATDSDLISKLISQNGLSNNVEETTIIFEEIVQYYATDWDMLLTRAEMNAMVVNVKDSKITVGVPDTTKAPDLIVTYGESIIDLNIKMNAATQFSTDAIRSRSWDSKTQTVIEAGPHNWRVIEPGNLSSSKLAKVFGINNVIQQTGAPLELAALENWSTAKALRSKLSKIRGTVSFQGNAVAQTGAMIALAGLSTRFNGNAYISGVRHQISDGQWITEATLGLSANCFGEVASNIEAPAASGLLPGISGLQTGIVRSVTKDLQSRTHVEIALPLLRGDANTVWARLSTLYASKPSETTPCPVIGEEVIVGFMNEDPRYAVILGSVVST